MQKNPDTEQLFCDTLIDMMENTPLLMIRATELVKCAGTCRSTFYNYFDSVYSVLQKIEDDFFHELESEISAKMTQLVRKEPAEVVKELVRYSANNIKRNAKLIRVLLSANGDLAFQAKLKSVMKKANQSALSFATPKLTEAQEDFCLEYMLAGQLSIVHWYAQNEPGLSDADLNDVIEVGLRMNYSILMS